MEYALSAYIDAGERMVRAHCELNQRSLELGIAFFETLAESWAALLPSTAARRAITSISRSHFGDHAVITAQFPQHRRRG